LKKFEVKKWFLSRGRKLEKVGTGPWTEIMGKLKEKDEANNMRTRNLRKGEASYSIERQRRNNSISLDLRGQDPILNTEKTLCQSA
jgi:hypothetical protein